MIWARGRGRGYSACLESMLSRSRRSRARNISPLRATHCDRVTARALVRRNPQRRHPPSHCCSTVRLVFVSSRHSLSGVGASAASCSVARPRHAQSQRMPSPAQTEPRAPLVQPKAPTL